MEFLIWMAIGIALMAVELVVPGGILGLIGYCAFLWGVRSSSMVLFAAILRHACIRYQCDHHDYASSLRCICRARWSLGCN